METDPLKREAYKAVCIAKKEGRLQRPTICESCGKTAYRMLLHHWSYLTENAVDVIPLCASCHRRVHCGRIAEPRTGRIYDYVNGAKGKHWTATGSYRHRHSSIVTRSCSICGKTATVPRNSKWESCISHCSP